MISKAQKTESTKNSNAEGTVEVLYQKLGDRWFAFSVVDNEVFVGSLTPEEIEAMEPKSKLPVGNS